MGTLHSVPAIRWIVNPPRMVKLRFRTKAEGGSAAIRLKVEINTREIDAFDPPRTVPLEIENPWFTGSAEIATYSREELLATKLRALLQRISPALCACKRKK